MADNQFNNKKRGRPKITVKRKRNIHFLNKIQLPTSNRFSALAANNGSDNDMLTDEQEQQQATKKTTVSPIVVTDHVTDIQEILTALKVDFNLKLNSVGRKIFLKSIEDKNKTIEALKSKNINFFTHPEKETKEFKVILSGMPQVDTKLIESSLAEQQLTATKITMFNTKSSNKLYLLHFDAAQVNKKTLESIKYVYHHTVKWLPYKPKRNGPTICMRCCMWGHGARNCLRYTVCMLCAGEHLTKECTTHNIATNTNTNNPQNFNCFNCKSANLVHNHKANDVNCPFRQKYETARESARNKTKPNQRTAERTPSSSQAPPPPSRQTSYADSMRVRTTSTSRSQQNAPTTSNNTQSQAHTNTNTRFNNTSSHPSDNSNTNPSSNLWSFDECANILFDSIEQLQKCNSKLEQLKVIANLLKHACT